MSPAIAIVHPGPLSPGAARAYLVSLAVLAARDPQVRRALGDTSDPERMTVLAGLDVQRPGLRLESFHHRGDGMRPGPVLHLPILTGWVMEHSDVAIRVASLAQELAPRCGLEREQIIPVAAATSAREANSFDFEIRDTLRRFGDAPLPLS